MQFVIVLFVIVIDCIYWLYSFYCILSNLFILHYLISYYVLIIKSVCCRLFTYPPPPATGGIAVTNEDFYCLNDGEFLNDVIIDFYLK